MASLLEGALKKKVAKAFHGKLCKGQIRRETPGGLNEFGDPIGASVATYPFEGIRESFSASFKAQAGIPDDDVSILVLLGTTTVVPKQDDKIFVGEPFNAWHQARKIMEIDPAGASCKIQAYVIPTP